MTADTAQATRAETLRQLHLDPTLLELVNVWDVGSARTIADRPGTTALATASAAVADSHGFADGEHIPWSLHREVLARICAAVELPVTADLERGYGDVTATVTDALEAGVVGANLEDDLCPADEMADRVREARAAGDRLGVELVINARTDVYLTGPRDLADAVARGQAYFAAGADCVFVPGCTDEAEIAELAGAFGPGRLSLLAVAGIPTVDRLTELGVARLSHGPYAYRHALASLATYPPR